jgi:hypothetical protein
MRKNNLKKVFAALAMSAVAVSATSVAASASDYTDAIRTGQANEAVEYNASAYKASSAYQSADGATITPTISIDKVEVKEADAPGSTQAVKFKVSGASGKYASVGVHFVYDQRLTIGNITQPKSIVDDATGDETYVGSSGLSLSQSKIEPGLAFFAFMGSDNNGQDGELVTVRFTLPDDAKGGDLYPIGVEFMSNATAEDGFGDVPRTDAGKLMQAYVFTQGIENGYISVLETPTETEPSSEEESSEPETESDTTAEDTTAEDTAAEDTTAEGTQADTTGAAGSTTGSAATTTQKAEDSVPTGVAGVGVAVAGLAVAVGTAFVLRKKED